MEKNFDSGNNVIMKGIHCPYCQENDAILINKGTSRKYSLQYPAYGLKFMLSILFLSGIYILRYGMKLIEIVKTIDNVTYCFCPKCGNSYSLNAPKEIMNEVEDKKLYKIKQGGLISGICKGISSLTEIPLLWIRIMTVIYGITEVIMLYIFFDSIKFSIFSFKTLSSDAFNYVFIPIVIIISIAIVFCEYLLFSLLLKTKVEDDEEE